MTSTALNVTRPGGGKVHLAASNGLPYCSPNGRVTSRGVMGYERTDRPVDCLRCSKVDQGGADAHDAKPQPLTFAMRRGLLGLDTGTYVRPGTLDALERRGLAYQLDANEARAQGSFFELTEAGRRAVEKIRAEMDATPIVPTDSYPQGADIPQERIERNAAVIARKMLAPTEETFDPFWVRNLVERVGRELHDLDMLATDIDYDAADQPWSVGHRAGFEHAAEYLTSSIEQPIERLGLAAVLAATRAGATVAELAAIPQNQEG